LPLNEPKTVTLVDSVENHALNRGFLIVPIHNTRLVKTLFKGCFIDFD